MYWKILFWYWNKVYFQLYFKIWLFLKNLLKNSIKRFPSFFSFNKKITSEIFHRIPKFFSQSSYFFCKWNFFRLGIKFITFFKHEIEEFGNPIKTKFEWENKNFNFFGKLKTNYEKLLKLIRKWVKCPWLNIHLKSSNCISSFTRFGHLSLSWKRL